MEIDANVSETLPDRFCPHCAASIVPLNVPHLHKQCEQCHRTKYFIRHNEVSGITTEPGESFTIPAGWIKLSLQPAPNGRMFRAGLRFLLDRIFTNYISPLEDFRDNVSRLEQEYDRFLTTTEFGKNLNPQNVDDVKKMFDEFAKDRQSCEWYSLMTAVHAGFIKEHADDEKFKEAAWRGYLLGAFQSAAIVTEPVFEETLWRGYLANEIIAEADNAVAHRSPAEKEALNRLQPLFERLDEVTLDSLVKSGLPVGPRINVKLIDEAVLLAAVRHHANLRERARQKVKEDREALEAAEERSIKLYQIFSAIVIAVVGAGVALWVKYA
jgi:hypothetical protein